MPANKKNAASTVNIYFAAMLFNLLLSTLTSASIRYITSTRVLKVPMANFEAAMMKYDVYGCASRIKLCSHINLLRYALRYDHPLDQRLFFKASSS